MNFSEHPPPHFHVTYGNQQATVDIVDLRVIAGRLSPRVLGMVMEWAALHQVELVVDWELARQQRPLHKVAPLE